MTVPLPQTNLLAMPQVTCRIETGANEDWVDSILFFVDDGTGTDDVTNLPQLDLSGIKFEMEVRHQEPNHEVVLTATTDNDTLRVGDPPDHGFLLINIDYDKMRFLLPGPYVADIVGIDAEVRRRVIIIDLTVVEGITR